MDLIFHFHSTLEESFHLLSPLNHQSIQASSPSIPTKETKQIQPRRNQNDKIRKSPPPNRRSALPRPNPDHHPHHHHQQSQRGTENPIRTALRPKNDLIPHPLIPLSPRDPAIGHPRPTPAPLGSPAEHIPADQSGVLRLENISRETTGGDC